MVQSLPLALHLIPCSSSYVPSLLLDPFSSFPFLLPRSRASFPCPILPFCLSSFLFRCSVSSCLSVCARACACVCLPAGACVCVCVGGWVCLLLLGCAFLLSLSLSLAVSFGLHFRNKERLKTLTQKLRLVQTTSIENELKINISRLRQRC